MEFAVVRLWSGSGKFLPCTPCTRKAPGASDPSLRRRLPRILVVDDNPNTMNLMHDLLSSRGYDVVALPDAAQAEAEIFQHPPDLVLSDVIMPGKSGYELCHELKENPVTRLIPFVLITGLAEREDRVRGIEAGADDFLSKPIFPEELFARVKSLLKLKEFTDELETAESVLCTLGLSVESRDPYTEGHCERLAKNASNLGGISIWMKKMSLPCAGGLSARFGQDRRSR